MNDKASISHSVSDPQLSRQTKDEHNISRPKPNKSIIGMLNQIITPIFKRSQSPISDRNANYGRISPDLDSYVFVEEIELSHFERTGGRNWRKSEHDNKINHNFQRMQLSKPSWCDQCGDFIWGAYKDCLRCQYCDYTCHYGCGEKIQACCKNHCNGRHSFNEPTENCQDTIQTHEGLQKKIEAFNKNLYGLTIELIEDTDNFIGSIRIYLQLFRPIKMTIKKKNCNDLVHQYSSDSESTDSILKTVSYHLPRSASQVIRIDSLTTTPLVIQQFLKKYHIAENVCKFDLYESVLLEEGHASIRKLSNEDFPLIICLNWSANGLANHQFILREKDSNDIQWDAFSIPELESFLRIIKLEEEELGQQIREKYIRLKNVMLHRLHHAEKYNDN